MTAFHNAILVADAREEAEAVAVRDALAAINRKYGTDHGSGISSMHMSHSNHNNSSSSNSSSDTKASASSSPSSSVSTPSTSAPTSAPTPVSCAAILSAAIHAFYQYRVDDYIRRENDTRLHHEVHTIAAWTYGHIPCQAMYMIDQHDNDPCCDPTDAYD